jgi:hypothetical protein
MQIDPGRRLGSQHLEAMRLRRQAERAVVSGHFGIDIHRFLPKQCGREMNRIEGSWFRWHWLCDAVQNDRVNLDQLERVDEVQNRLATAMSVKAARIRTRSSVRRLSVEISALEMPRSVCRHSGNAFG